MADMPAPSPIVEFASVQKRFGDGPLVLDGIDFSAKHGDFVSLIGPSGCGKSTWLRLLAGLSPLTSGSIKIDGVTPGLAKRELAFVFQEPTLLPWLSVQKNVEVPLTLRHSPPEQRKTICHRALERVRLLDKATAFPRQLSGGQKMRVSLARALSLSPEILLLDEPFGSLDEITRDHLNEELLALRQEQVWTAFFVTHSVNEAVFLSNRIIVLAPNPGRIHAEIIVPFPYPRTVETRRSEEFFHLVREVSRLLRVAEQSALS
jgi:NitT/TauT family transport system ATP-binding protein